MIEIFNIKKVNELEKRIKAIENYTVDIKLEKKNNDNVFIPVIFSDDTEGELWIK